MSQGSGPTRRGESESLLRSLTSNTQVRGSFNGVGNASSTTTVPFLTNVESHFGRVTLTAPDNMRRTKKRTAKSKSAHPASSSGIHAVPAQTLSSERAATTRTQPRRERSTTSMRTTATRELDRRVNVWDSMGVLTSTDDADPPPPFVPSETPSARPSGPPIPRSPPPAFVSEDEESDHDEVEYVTRLPAPVDPVKLRESDAWERDRLLGFSLEERVARMERRRAGVPHPSMRNTISTVTTQPETVRWNRPAVQSDTVEFPTLEVPKAPQALTRRDHGDTVDDTSSEDSRLDEVDNSDEEWQHEHDALEALHRQEADTRHEQQSRESLPRRVPPIPDSGVEPPVSRPLPPPPPSRVPYIRSAYDQLRMWQSQNRLPEALNRDMNEHEERLLRRNASMPGHFGSAFSNAQSSVAPLPRQVRLPVVTDATRHFPRSEPTSASAQAIDSTQEFERSVLTTEHADIPEVQVPEAVSESRHTEDVQPENVSESNTDQDVAMTATQPSEEAQPLDASEGITDLDVAVAHLDHPATHYEWATLISDFLGPAREQTQRTTEELEGISVGRVELEHRRVTTSGQVRVRLSVAGMRVDRCGICLEQFREGQLACILPCFHMCVLFMTDHSFHNHCTIELLRHAQQCPVCRRDILRS